MTYTAEISRTNPVCFVFLVDQSDSMNDKFGGSEVGDSKAKSVALAMNRLLQTLVIKCSKDEGVRRYFDVSVIGYSTAYGVRAALGGALTGRELVGIDEIAQNPMRVIEITRKQSDGAGGLVEVTARMPLWLDPDETGSGGTPMCGAFDVAHNIMSAWVAQHPKSYPPILINLTDGEANDWNTPQDLLDRANNIRTLATEDGNALIYNVHLSSTRAPSVHFPSDSATLASPFSKILFDASSLMPANTLEEAKRQGYAVADGARGFVFNAEVTDVISFLDIGTRPSNLR